MAKVVKKAKEEKGSIELIVIGLLAALIIVLAIPFLRDIGTAVENNLGEMNAEL